MKPVYLCQTNFSHVWGEMPLLGRCLECDGELILHIPKSSHDELLEAAKESKQFIEDIVKQGNPDKWVRENSYTKLRTLEKAIAKASLTAGEEK